jgi:FkbM family methyltransferase
MNAQRLVTGMIRRARGRPSQSLSDEIDKAYLAIHLPLDPVIVEAGAHVGYDTVELSKRFPGGAIHAFEPIPALYRQLAERTADLANVTTYEKALGGASGRSKMWVSGGGGDQASSLRRPALHLEELPTITFDEQIAVEVTTLDDWAREHDVPSIDLLWLDLQGAELDLLKGSPGCMATVAVIHTEVMATEQYEGVPLYPEMLAWMEQRGFGVAVEKRPWPNGAGNVVFVRSRPPHVPGELRRHP